MQQKEGLYPLDFLGSGIEGTTTPASRRKSSTAARVGPGHRDAYKPIRFVTDVRKRVVPLAHEHGRKWPNHNRYREISSFGSPEREIVDVAAVESKRFTRR